ncbi:hypothetical protein [Deinococcus pimensis]|uniref:hypothetical protein n=1 Tax=Deinococcus pimensis TaxID=309888 RepID=UPI000481621E|nr:hypothetical protein [Deinococcus pimensis]
MHDEPKSGTSNIDANVARTLVTALNGTPEGGVFEVLPSSDLASLLEVYVPHLLSRRYPAWAWETLDGVYVTRARKVRPHVAELAGAGLLMSDQAWTPLAVRLALADSRDEVASYLVRLGEPGGGRLRISGPPYGRSGGFVESVVSRLDDVEWVYRVEGDAQDD